MTAPVKETTKVTSGKDTAAFVAAKPVEHKAPTQEKPEDIGPTEEELRAHQERLKKLDDEFEQRKAELAAQQQTLEREVQEKLDENSAKLQEQSLIAAAASDRANELGKAHFAGDGVTRQLDVGEDQASRRGAPIPIAEQKSRVRHISELDPSYNGKADTIEEV